MDSNPTASSAPPPPWIDLPKDVTANILGRLPPNEILNWAERVCTTWRSVCKQPSFWRTLHLKTTGGPIANYYANGLCRCAVDRSQGELIDISIKIFGTDDLLQYVSERSRRLRFLWLRSCYDISPGGLTTAVKNFPQLQELHLFWNSISAIDIETIGVSCPTLKSFTFYTPGFCFVVPGLDIDNSDALSIAKTMPNLVSLCFFGNRLNNEGLEAILSGCPNLELLDLEMCFHVDLKCDFGRRCSEQIIVFRPNSRIARIKFVPWHRALES